MGSASLHSSNLFVRGDEPIITSLLDTDWYKLTMLQFVWLYYPDIRVRSGLNNRSKRVSLKEDIRSYGHLKAELDHVATLRFTEPEIHKLRLLRLPVSGLPVFREDFLAWLGELRLPQCELDVTTDGRNPTVEVEDFWSRMILWEIYKLAITNQLRNEQVMAREGITPGYAFRAGEGKLQEKIDFWKARPHLRFSDFGTRRRASKNWQYYIDQRLAEELGPEQFLGTSNVYNALELGINPIGTKAHELDMVMAAAAYPDAEAMRRVIFDVMRNWWQMYGCDLSIGLPDTFGSEFFFANVPAEIIRTWKGMRGDSGDLIVESDRYMDSCRRFDVDPKTKLYVPSDGLDCQQQARLDMHVTRTMPMASGIGTYITNDVVVEPVSIVDKPIGVRVGETLVPTCKLSNNPAKAQGALAEEYKKIFDYHPGAYEECRY